MRVACTNSSGTRCDHCIHTISLRFLLEAGASRRALGALARFATELYRLFVAEDAELAEINPLAVTANGQVTALDAKAGARRQCALPPSRLGRPVVRAAGARRA